jgi:hypothetical protein
MRNTFFALVLLLVLGFSGTPAGAAELGDLSQGLSFLRLGELGDSGKNTFSQLGDMPTLVLDLREAKGDGSATANLLAALRGRPAGKGICLVLISSATAPELLAGLAHGVPGCLTLGRESADYHPDIAVATTAAAEQSVHDAFLAGTPPAALLATPGGKPRHDEAELAKDHAAGKSTTAEDDPTPPPASKTALKESAPPKATAPFDTVLQRAVQIHRGLLALGKIK